MTIMGNGEYSFLCKGSVYGFSGHYYIRYAIKQKKSGDLVGHIKRNPAAKKNNATT